MRDNSPAKRILSYLDIDETERRLNKIMEIFDEYAGRVAVQEKVVHKIHRHYEKVYKTVFIPVVDMAYVPKRNSNIWLIMSDIAKFVCEKHGITIEQLKRNSPPEYYGNDHTGLCRKLYRRCNILVNARQEFVQIAKSNHFDEITYESLAYFLGYNDHTSVIHLWRERKRA